MAYSLDKLYPVNQNESERYYSTGSLMDRAPTGPKTDRGHLIKDNFYCPKTSKMAKGRKKVVPPGVEPRASDPVHWAPHAAILLTFFLIHNTHTHTQQSSHISMTVVSTLL